MKSVKRKLFLWKNKQVYNMDKSSFSIKEANFIDSNSILFIRVKVNDLSKAVEYILKVFKDESWLKNIEEDYLRESIEACTSDTVKELEKNLHHTNGDDVSKEVVNMSFRNSQEKVSRIQMQNTRTFHWQNFSSRK